MNPKKFGKLANHRQERWKQPLPQFIERIYFKHFGKACPDRVLSLEDWARQKEQKKQEKKQRREERREQAHLEAEAAAPAVHAAGLTGPGHNVNATMLRLLDPFRFVLIAVSGPMDNRQSSLIDPSRRESGASGTVW